MANYIIVLVLAFLGFCISWYIYYKKNKQEKMVCYLGEDCDKVISSKYNKLFGFSNEILGMLYYIFVAVLVVLLIYGVESILISLYLVLVLAGIGAVLFSIYLTYIQIYVIREWCEYCVASAAVSVLILVFELI